MAADGSKSVTLRHNGRDAKDEEVYRHELKGGTLWLCLNYVFTPSEGEEADTVTACWSEDGQNWNDCGFTLKMLYTLDLFTGYRTALYCYPTSTEGGYADFDFFHQRMVE